MPSSSAATSLFLAFTEPLGGLGMRYMVTGSVATIIYGEPRLTHDLDLVLELGSDADADAARLLSAFPPGDFHGPPIETIRIEARRRLRGHFDIVHHQTGFKADVYLAGQDPLHRWGLGARRAVTVAGCTLWLAPPAYVIVRKLEYHREGGGDKHLADIRAVLRLSGHLVDFESLVAHVEHLGLDEQWALVAEARRAG